MSDVLFWLLVICNTTYDCKTTAHSLLGGRYQIASHLISIPHQRLTEKKPETMKATPEIYNGNFLSPEWSVS